jgi:hypothetical protein
MSKEVFDAAVIIARRKAEFYERSNYEFLDQLPKAEKDEAKAIIRKAISEVDNSLFVGNKEKETKIMNPSTPVEELGLDKEKIVSEVIRKLNLS